LSLSIDFENYCAEIKLDKTSMLISAGSIAKKLNKVFYDCDNDTQTHLYIVGSVGRDTAITKTSDLDIIFDLPTDIYTQYDNYSGNGQSQLLQDIKAILLERYPNTNIRGDGQVVVIEFSSYIVELVPGFKQSDNCFKYPDTHDGGSWKYTDPLAEQGETESSDVKSVYNFRNFCRLIRKWKNNCGVVIGGLLIDSLCYNHFSKEHYYGHNDYSSYYDILSNVFEYINGLDKDQSYWFALGSNQQVINTDNGAFIDKACEAYDKLVEATNEDKKYDALAFIFGHDFPRGESSLSAASTYSKLQYRNTEQFIEDLFPVNIIYNLRIDCRVSQNGFRDFMLRRALCENHYILRHDKSLMFKIVDCTVPIPYHIYWKVRNVGQWAEDRDMIRGQVLLTDKNVQYEHSNFQGPHFVECYIVKNGVCVARDRIDVPIGSV